MINLRYHIVSITAVFLALAIGVALGSTLIQRATVETLENRLQELDERLDRTDGENERLRSELVARDRFAAQFEAEAGALLAGHLTDVPVLVLTVQGVEEELVAATRGSLALAGARVSGTLRFTSRWNDLSEEEVAELSALLNRRLSSADLVRSLVLQRIAAEMTAAAAPPPEPEPPAPAPAEEPDAPGLDGEQGEPAEGGVDPVGDEALSEEPAAMPDEITAPTPPLPPSAEIIEALLALGYLEFFPESAPGPLPAHGTRFAFVDGPGAVLQERSLLLAWVEALATDSSAHLVVGEAAWTGEEAGVADRDQGLGLVGLIRSSERLRELVSTVDALDGLVGQAAVVLALASGEVGHFGVGEGASSLLPGSAQR